MRTRQLCGTFALTIFLFTTILAMGLMTRYFTSQFTPVSPWILKVVFTWITGALIPGALLMIFVLAAGLVYLQSRDSRNEMVLWGMLLQLLALSMVLVGFLHLSLTQEGMLAFGVTCAFLAYFAALAWTSGFTEIESHAENVAMWFGALGAGIVASGIFHSVSVADAIFHLLILTFLGSFNAWVWYRVSDRIRIVQKPPERLELVSTRGPRYTQS